MDDRRFDSLVKLLASGTNRRTLLKGLLGLSGAGLAGGLALDQRVEGARRPTPTPKPPTCPGNQTWNGTKCVCPPNLSQCVPDGGPACCNDQVDKHTDPNYSECCDNACCQGTCTAEEVCCPTNVRPGNLPPIANVCPNGECCFLPNVCSSGVCAPPASCEGNQDCDPCETCNLQSGQCEALCEAGQQCCDNDNGQYCIPDTDVCCDSNDDCPGECSTCLESGVCGIWCEQGEICCDGPNGGECCAANQCIAGQGCCVADSVNCGGACCSESACNNNSECCLVGIACGAECCGINQICTDGQCECVSDAILCNGECVFRECCGDDNSNCANLGYDLECTECIEGGCAVLSLEGATCSIGYCYAGECLICLPPEADCQDDHSACCSGLCLPNGQGRTFCAPS